MSELKSFQVGLYKFEPREIRTADERAIKEGSIIGCIFPLHNTFVFGVERSGGRTKTISRKNLTLLRVITLQYEEDFILSPSLKEVTTTWSKMNSICKELEQRDNQKPLHAQKNLHAIPDLPGRSAEDRHQIHQ